MRVSPTEQFELVFFEGVEMPVRELKDGKWEPTGKKELTYQYTFVSTDEFAEKFVFFLNPGELDLRKHKGEKGFIVFEIKQKEFQGKRTTTTKLVGFTPGE